MAGGDLTPRKAVLVQKHLEFCTSCRDEYELYRLSLESIKKRLDFESLEWEERDWSMSLQKASVSGKSVPTTLAPWPFRKGLAWTAMAAAAILLTFFALHPFFFKNGGAQKASLQPHVIQPEVLSMRLVSEETGLKINWFFHKDLKLEVMK
jgi:hypothetical protein